MHDVSSDLGRPAVAGTLEGERGTTKEVPRGNSESIGAGQTRREAVGYPYQAIRAVRLLNLISRGLANSRKDAEL